MACIFRFEKRFFCKYCPHFVHSAVEGHSKMAPLNKLVTQSLTSFAKLLGRDGALFAHEKNEYHLHTVEAAMAFLNVQVNEKFA